VNALFAAAADIQAFCTARGWRGTIIGGLAVQRWGEPRQTRDVDLTIVTGLGGEERFVDALLEAYQARIPDARRFALERRVLLLETATRVPLDISLAGLPYESRIVDRSSAFAIDAGLQLTTCSAEDLVVLKAFADRPQDWLDVEGIVVRQAASLDRQLIVAELRALLELKEDDEAEERLVNLFRKHPA
jgi:hypothetical protein